MGHQDRINPHVPVGDEISRRVLRLPEPLQAEVLRFVDYLLMRAQQDEARQEDQAWLSLSLRSAMRGLEGEGGPDYSEADLKEPFS
jgi:hypothetical protein